MIISYFTSAGKKKAIFEYTGACDLVSQIVTIDSAEYALYRLRESGVLKVSDGTKVWACGGGSNGANGITTSGTISGSKYWDAFAGGGGGGGYTSTGDLSQGEYTVTIGAGGSTGGATTIVAGSVTYLSAAGATAAGNTVSTGGNGGSGGSGGGAAGSSSEWDDSEEAETYTGGTPGKGDGKSTIPFGLSSLNRHCAGGAGGSVKHGRGMDVKGGVGGTNGGNGGASAFGEHTSGNSGGNYGGGKGGYGSTAAGAATFYGGGGGGGGADAVYTNAYNGAAGYQGCVYVAIPA